MRSRQPKVLHPLCGRPLIAYPLRTARALADRIVMVVGPNADAVVEFAGSDVRAVVQTQRTATMRMLQEFTRLKSSATAPGDLAWRLVLDAMVFRAEAEVRWLDHCESSLVRYAPAREATQVTEPKARSRHRPQETDMDPDHREASAR